MSNLQRRTNAAYGIERWLSSKGYKVTNKTTADITAAFLKSKGLEYQKFNKRYKGLWTPIIWNAYPVQEHFNEFTKFVLENFGLDGKLITKSEQDEHNIFSTARNKARIL